MQNQILQLKIEKYDQKGRGIGFYNNIPIYIFGAIKNEVVEIQIINIFKKFMIGKIVNIVVKSKNRSSIQVENQELIGGYELLHMNYEEQKAFKLEKVENDFQKIANYKLKQLDFVPSLKQFKYRNKIVLHDGFFYQKNTNTKIEIDDFLLSDIKWDKNKKGNVIYRQLDTLIYGIKTDNKYTYDTSGKYKFRVGLNSFYQINQNVSQKVYEEISNFIIQNGITLDLYSGIGTIGIYASNKSKNVICVENNSSSHNDAIFNSKLNNISNINFIKADVNKYLLKNKTIKIDTLILDPPRTGVGSINMKIINQLKPKRIIYLSCNPGTQAADFNHIKDNYNIIKSQIFDMFPQTYHIENLLICDLKEIN